MISDKIVHNNDKKTCPPFNCYFCRMSALCFGLRCETHANERTNAVPALGKKWDNVSTEAGEMGLYIPEFSKPTGKYVSKLLVKLLNVLLRKGSLVFTAPVDSSLASIRDSIFPHFYKGILGLGDYLRVQCKFFSRPIT
jgi:hypothetical protein